MLRLGLRLTLRSGTEALARLLVTVGAVAIGVVVLVALLADFHAFQATSHRPSWESSWGVPAAEATPGDTLWSFSENLYRGSFIEQLDLAALGSGSPVPPGIPRLPGPGQYYASPALAALLRSVPADQLGNRFPGTLIGTIGDAALSGPDELVVMVGYAPAQLAARQGTVAVASVATAPQSQGTTNLYRLAFGLGALALLFPLLILINTATRLAAARREERYAALRLVGGTPRQVGVVASVDAIASGLLGALVGVGAFLLARPALARLALSGARFFAYQVTPTAAGYAGVLVGVPVAAAVAARLSLRRVRISPLGVSRKVTRPPPRAWRVLPLLVGVPLFIAAVRAVPLHSPNPDLKRVFLSFLLVMVGLVVAGSWLTMRAAWLLGRIGRRAPAVLAARRLADNPKGSFRTVGGLTLAVFVGTAVAVVVPSVRAGQSPTTAASLTNVLRVPFDGLGKPEAPGLDSASAAELTHSLVSYPGVSVVPIYFNPAFMAAIGPKGPPGPGQGPGPAANLPDDSVISCAGLQALPVLGTCGQGVGSVQLDVSNLFTDNPLNLTRNLPLVSARSTAGPADVAGLEVRAMLVRTSDATTLERVRTFLTAFEAKAGGGGAALVAYQMGSVEPETFGEVARIRNNDVTNIERVILALLGLTLLVAGCSLAVTAGGSIIERRRQFTLLRLGGTAVSSLGRVVLLEAVVPLVTTAVVAAAAGLAVSIPLINKALPFVGTHYPGGVYYLTMGLGVAAALGVILATMPLLRRVTDPRNARFE